MILKKVLMFLMLGCLLAFVACEQEPEEEVSELIGIWELDSMSTLDADGELVVEEGEDNPMTFPMDYIVMVTEDATDHDLNDDGTDEALTMGLFVEVTADRIRMYAEVVLTDSSSVIPTYMTGIDTSPGNYGLPFYENAIKYNSTDDIDDYTIDGSTLTGLDEEDATWSVSGSTLTLDVPDDQETPDDTSDDTTMRMSFTKATSDDIDGATDDTTLSIFN